MKTLNTKELRSAISEYAKPSDKLAFLIFFSDIFLYITAIAGSILFENIWLKICCGVFAGLRIGTLFLISHDAGHDCFTSKRLWNKVIGRIAFLPSFHNYSLWLIAHNRLHHQAPNVKGLNSWSPLDIDEYDKLSPWGKILERLYRSPFGISLNYMVERWWKDKFYPYKRLVGNRKLSHWLDFMLVATYMFSFISMLVFLGIKVSHTTSLEVLAISFFLPFFVSNFLIGFTIYQHHTHEDIPWFKTLEESRRYVDQEDVTIHVRYPDWYNLISNNAMEHTAHHVDPRIPLYNLSKAQKLLCNLYGDKIISMDFSIRDFLNTMGRCKLYDYEHHCWLDFNGDRTSKAIVYEQEQDETMYANAA